MFKSPKGFPSLRQKRQASNARFVTVHRSSFSVPKAKTTANEGSCFELGKQNLVFTIARGDHLTYRTVYDCFKRIVKKMGYSELRFHDLRHQYAVIAIKNGDDIKTIQGNLGHATAAFTLDVYGHVKSSNSRLGLDVLL